MKRLPILVAATLVALAFGLTGPAFAQAAERCTKQTAQRVGEEQLLPRVAEMKPGFYTDVAGDVEFAAENPLCRDLTGDGEPEMVVVMSCCTGGSLQPWGIFSRDDEGAWALAYAAPNDNLRRRLRLIRRGVKAVTTVRYEGACTRRVRSHLVRWNGRRFSGKTSRPYNLPRLRGC